MARIIVNTVFEVRTGKKYTTIKGQYNCKRGDVLVVDGKIYTVTRLYERHYADGTWERTAVCVEE